MFIEGSGEQDLTWNLEEQESAPKIESSGADKPAALPSESAPAEAPPSVVAEVTETVSRPRPIRRDREAVSDTPRSSSPFGKRLSRAQAVRAAEPHDKPVSPDDLIGAEPYVGASPDIGGEFKEPLPSAEVVVQAVEKEVTRHLQEQRSGSEALSASDLLNQPSESRFDEKGDVNKTAERLVALYGAVVTALEQDEAARHQAEVANLWLDQNVASRLRTLSFEGSELEIGITADDKKELRLVYETFAVEENEVNKDIRSGGIACQLGSDGRFSSETYLYSQSGGGSTKSTLQTTEFGRDAESVTAQVQESLSHFEENIQLYMAVSAEKDESLDREMLIENFQKAVDGLEVDQPQEVKDVLEEEDIFTEIGANERFSASKNQEGSTSFTYTRGVLDSSPQEFLIGFFESDGTITANQSAPAGQGKTIPTQDYTFNINDESISAQQLRLVDKLTNCLERYAQVKNERNN